MWVRLAIVFSITCAAIGSPIDDDRVPAPFIIGGKPSDIRNSPWQVSLYIWVFDTHFCGGSIIGPKEVLTACHCFEGFPEGTDGDIQVRVGSSSRSKGGVLHDVTKIVRHERFHKPTLFNNDITFIKLKTPIVFNKLAQPIALPDAGKVFADGTNILVTGWGVRDNDIDAIGPDNLHAVTVPIVKWKICQKIYKELKGDRDDLPEVTTNMVCAGLLHKGGKDACYGDSGGPAAVTVSGKRILLGIVSWGNECAQPDFPGVYTEVAKFVPWIKNKIQTVR